MNFDDILDCVQEHPRQDPGDVLLLSVAYEAARRSQDSGQRLFFAMRLAENSQNAHHHIVYGVECGKNLMLDRAQAAFEKAIQLKADDVRALNGLGNCHLQKFALDAAEELFHQSIEVGETMFARQGLETIQRLRNPTAWTEEEKRQQKFRHEWADTRPAEISKGEQARLLAESLLSYHLY